MDVKEIICNTLQLADKLILLKMEGYKEIHTPIGSVYTNGRDKVEYDQTNETWLFPDGEFYLEYL